MKILIVGPEIHRLGGVANHYLGLSKHWTYEISYLFYGKRNDSTPSWKVLLLYPYDYLRFTFIMIFKKYDVVIINPSLRKFQIIRDGLFLLIAKLFRKDVITFIHGFDVEYSKKLERKRGLFQRCYNKSLFIYTLFSGFKLQLQNIGITCPILLTTTKVSDELLTGKNIPVRSCIKNLLFVARINANKGIFIVLETYKILKPKYPYLTLTVCGDGPALAEAQILAKQNALKDVIFKGNITGDDLSNAYLKGDLYILPTKEEGMATTILEAMAFGLPVISRPVGGVVDFWEQGKMGYLLESFNPIDYVKIIENLILNPSLTSNISSFNKNYASKHFLASSVTKRFEKDIKNHYLHLK